MNSFNFNMFQLILKHIGVGKKLAPSLLEIFSDGFLVMNDCYFLNKLFQQQAHINASDFVDKTGYECFINSLHIDDYVENDFFIQAMLLTERLISEWNKLNNHLILEVVLSETDFGVNVKFHVLRQNENWVNENELNKFSEAIMICRS
jgi:hypothetical protein